MEALVFPELNYDCLTCGKSCGGWRVLVDDEARERLAHHPRVEAVRAAGYEPFLQGPDGLWRLGENEAGRCHYLREDRLCSVHADSGLEVKPRACRQFPFFLVETPAGTQIGLSFRCTAVQQNYGRPVAAHREQLEELARTGSYPKLGFDSIPFTRETSGSWADYLALEAYVRGSLRALPSACGAVAARPLGPYREGPGVTGLTEFLAAALIGYLETDQPDEMRGLTQALREGQPIMSRRLGREVSAPLLIDEPPDAEAARYLDHLVVRKYLLEGPSVLARLVGLSVLVPVLAWYRQIFDGDFIPGLEIVEGEVVGHVQPLESFYQSFEQSYLMLV